MPVSKLVNSILKTALTLILLSSSAYAEWRPLSSVFGGDGQDVNTRNDSRIPYLGNYQTCDYELRISKTSPDFLPYINFTSYVRLPLNSFNQSSDVKYVGNTRVPGFTWNDNNIFLDFKFDVSNTVLNDLSAAVTNGTSTKLNDLKSRHGNQVNCKAIISWYRPTPSSAWISRQHFLCEYPGSFNASNGRTTTSEYYGKLTDNTAQVYYNCK